MSSSKSVDVDEKKAESSLPLHVTSVDEFHKFHETKEWQAYVASQSSLTFSSWYGGRVDGIIHHTTMTALANNWDFNPAMHRDGPGGKVHWDLKTNELYVKMVAPSASSTEFAVEDLKLVLVQFSMWRQTLLTLRLCLPTRSCRKWMERSLMEFSG